MRFLGSNSVETRDFSLENPSTSVTDPRAWSGGGSVSFSGEDITPDTAMAIPAFWACVDFISEEIALLPWEVFSVDGEHAVKSTSDPLYGILHDAANKRMSSQAFRKAMMVNVLRFGRAYAYIEKNKMGRVMSLWLLDPRPDKMRVIMNSDFSLTYEYRGPSSTVRYNQDEIIDLAWMPGADGVSHIEPVTRLKNALGLSVGAERYASKVFQNGGAAAAILSGNFNAASADRASQDIQDAMRHSRDSGRSIVAIDKQMSLTPWPVDPSKNQLLELRKFQVIEIARMFGLPPTTIGDLDKATYSNIEQADLNVVKHCLRHWTAKWEAECNLKFFGKNVNKRFCQFNMDYAGRGDFKTRMEGWLAGITVGLYSVNEARAKENLPPHAWGDNLLAPSGAQVIAGLAGAVDQAGNVWREPDAISDGGSEDVVSDDNPDNSVKAEPQAKPVGNAVANAGVNAPAD